MDKLSAWFEIENLRKTRDANIVYIERLNSEIAEKEAAFLREHGPVKIEIDIGGKEGEFAKVGCKEGNDE